MQWKLFIYITVTFMLSCVQGFPKTRPLKLASNKGKKWTDDEVKQLLKAARIARFRDTSIVQLPLDWERSAFSTFGQLQRMTTAESHYCRLPWSRYDKYEFSSVERRIIREIILTYCDITALLQSSEETRQWSSNFNLPFEDVSSKLFDTYGLQRSPKACAKEWYTRSDPYLSRISDIDSSTRKQLYEILNKTNGNCIEAWRLLNIPPYSCAYYYAIDKGYCSSSLTLDEQVAFLWSLHQLGFLDYDLILEVKLFGLRERPLVYFWEQNEQKIRQIVLDWFEVWKDDHTLLQGENNSHFLEFFATMDINIDFIIVFVVILNDLTEGSVLSQDLRIRKELFDH